MTFYGPTYPNEANYETLANARQRFGNRSANMFFLRPARHAACPRRLKFMQNIKTGFISYVEDSPYVNRSTFKTALQNSNDLSMDKTNGFGLYNSADAWRQELKELAQQVKSSYTTADEQEQYLRQARSARLNKPSQKRSSSSASSFNFDDNDEHDTSKRLLSRRANRHSQRAQSIKGKPANEKADQEQTVNDENQDPGIWLIPILCYILQIDNVFEAQDWLVNANPTEKRLAMELISRTMQDMQSQDSELVSDALNSDQSSTTNLNNVYWPYKVWQRQEKDRQQQQQIQTFIKQSKLTSQPSSNVDNGDTCERATSPLRMLTPAKRLLTAAAANNHHTPVEITVIERPSTRSTTDRTTPTIVIREGSSRMTDRSTTVEKRPSSRMATARNPNRHDQSSRRGYRVATSLNNSLVDDTNPRSAALRGKTPLI